MQKLARVIFPIITCCVVLVCGIIPASAYEVWNIYDHIDNVSFVGDYAHITFSLPQDNVQWAFYENGSFTYLSGQNVKYDVTAGQAFNLYFNPFGIIHSATPNDGAYFSDNFISTDDLPEDATFNHILKIGVSNGSSITYNTVNTIAYYVSSANQFLSKVAFPNSVEWDPEVYNLWIRSSDVPIDTTVGSGFHTQTVIESLKLPYSGSTNFAYEFSISFNISKAYFDYVNSGKHSQILEAIEDKLDSQGQTLDSILNGSQDQQDSADRFEDDMNESIKDIEDAGDAIDSVTVPTIIVENILPDDVLQGQEFLAYTGAIKQFWESPVLTSMFVILGGLMFVSFAIFGKKD